MIYHITAYQEPLQKKEVCESANPQGDWYWALNDGNLDVGPFISKEEAIADAVHAVEAYQERMGGVQEWVVDP